MSHLRSLVDQVERLNGHAVLSRKTQKASRQRKPRVRRLAACNVADGGLTAAAELGDLGLCDSSLLEAAQKCRPVNVGAHDERISACRFSVNSFTNIDLAYAQPMKTRSEYGSRLRRARQYAELSQKQLAARAGMSQGTVSELETTGQGSAMTLQLAAACGVDARWLATGEGQMLPDPVQDRVGISLTNLQKTLDIRTVVPTKTREQIMAGDLGGEFEWALDDDALAPDYVRGTALVWSTTKKPAVGSVVLLQDNSGHVHVRLYAQGRQQQLLGRAVNQNFATFDLAADDLRVLAVAKWQPMP